MPGHNSFSLFYPGIFMHPSALSCTAFQGGRCLATGPLADVALAAKAALDASAQSPSAPPVLVFDNATAEVIDLDWRGTPDDVLARLQAVRHAGSGATSAPTGDAPPQPPKATRGPGRPKLGVVAREVTLLPRHWEWLAIQPGGASVALRKLVEGARRDAETRDRVRQAGAVAYRFMATIAGHEPGFEEASRALFAGDRTRFEAHIAGWPADVQQHLKTLATDALAA